jgi:hypothetical protein
MFKGFVAYSWKSVLRLLLGSTREASLLYEVDLTVVGHHDADTHHGELQLGELEFLLA